MMFKLTHRHQYFKNVAQKINWGHWYVFFNTLWAVAIGSRYAFLIDWPRTLLGKAYFFISLIGHFSFLVFAFYLLFLFPLGFLIKNERTYRGISVILATLGMGLLLLDTEVFATFHFHLSSLVWNLLVNPENGELARQWQLFFTPLPLMLLIQMVYSRWSWQKLRSLERQKWLKFVGLFYLVAFSITHLMFAWGDATHYRPITMQKSNFPLSYPMTARSLLQRHGFLLEDNKYGTARNGVSFKMYYPKTSLSFSMADRPNILLITLTGWQKAMNLAEKMPILAGYLSQATVFTQHYGTAKTSQENVFSLFYGLFPIYQESVKRRNISPILLKTLASRHYTFCGFVDGERLNLLHTLKMHPTDYQQLGGKICSQSTFVGDFPASPWFIFLNLTLSISQAEGNIANITALDHYLGKIFTQLDWQKTIVVITGIPNATLSHHQNKQGFSRQDMAMPMFIFWKDLPKEKVEKLTSHLDFVPTLMQDIFKVDNPASDYSQGQSLFHSANYRPWVYAGDQNWNMLMTSNGDQYLINHKGDYRQLDRTGVPIRSSRPPLGLFLDFYQKEGVFWTK